MHLASWNTSKNALALLRPLTSEEIKHYENYVPIIVEARNRLCLFRILQKNYADWEAFLRKLLSADYKSKDDDQEELHRLLLNYLTVAYTITEHFDVSFQRRFRSDNGKQKEYAEFIERLCAKSFDYAFISDYRGYVQHVGLAVEFYNRVVSLTSVEIKVLVRPKAFVKSPRDWKKSKLTKDSKNIDLVETLTRYNSVVRNQYAQFVAKTFFPELVPAAEFFRKLTLEAQAGDQYVRMYLLEAPPAVTDEGGGLMKGKMKWIGAPNDVFKELGIEVTRTETPPK